MKISTIKNLSKEECERLLVDLESKNREKKSRLLILQLRYQDKRATHESMVEEINEVIKQLKILERETEKPPDDASIQDLEIDLLASKLKYQRLLRKMDHDAGTKLVMKEYEMLQLQTDIDTNDEFIELIQKQWRILDQN